MSQPWASLFIIFLAVYTGAFGLFHLMIFRVNKQLVSDQRIPHTLYWGHWNRLRNEYRRLYPGSHLYDVAVIFCVALLAIAVGFGILRTWDYLSN